MALHPVPDVADLLAHQHELQDQPRDPRSASRSFPPSFDAANYATIFTDPTWYTGYINSLIYVGLNTVISLTVRIAGGLRLLALPLSRRQASVLLAADQPDGAARGVRAALLPALFGSVGLFDTHIAVALAHCLFNVPLAVWILEGFMSGVPKEIDETAYIDGYSFPRFFVKIFMPLIASGIGVAAFFCFMFSWVELLLARTLTAVDAKPIAGDHDPHRGRLGLSTGVCWPPPGC
jgi:glycerol transport system permease protein